MKNLLILCFITLSFVSKAQDITVSEPEYIGNVIYVKNNQAVELEKQKVHITVKANAALMLTGLGRVSQKLIIKEPSSPVKIQEDRNLKFVVKVVDNKFDPFEIVEIYKLKKNYSDRSLLTAQTGSLTGSKAGDVVRIPYKATKYGTSSYLISVPEISMGEYAFNINLRTNTGTKDAADYTLHLFGITGTSIKKGDKLEYIKSSNTWLGTVVDIKGSNLIIGTSNQGHESEDKVNLEESEVRVISKEETSTETKYKPETLANDIKVGDVVKWKILYIDNWSGVYLGTKDDKAVIKTTDNGKTILKELDYNKVKLSK
jgi:hypothetical protein